jgi:hypothetical protein
VFPADENGRAGAVVDIPAHLKLWRVRVAVAPIVPARAVGPDDAAAFLQPPVRVYQHRADQADLVIGVGRIDQGVQRAGLNLGVVVEKKQV